MGARITIYGGDGYIDTRGTSASNVNGHCDTTSLESATHM